METKVLQRICDMIIDDNCMWIISDVWNCLFRYDFVRSELECTAVFPREIRDCGMPFSKIVKIRNEIYFIPKIAKNIFYYDLIEQKFQRLNMKFVFLKDEQHLDVVIQNEYIYCISRFPDTILKINSVTKEVKIFNAPNDSYINEQIESKIYTDYSMDSACLYNGKIIWPNYYNILTMFDIQEEKFSVCVLEELPQEKIECLEEEYQEKGMKDWIISVKNYKDILILTSYGGMIYFYDDQLCKNEEKSFKYYATDDDYKYQVPFFAGIVPIKDELFFIPQYKNRCIQYNHATKQWEEVMDSYLEDWEGCWRIYTVCTVVSEQKILIYSYYESCFYILNTEKNSVNKKKITMSFVNLIRKNNFFADLLSEPTRKKLDDIDYLLEQISYEKEDEHIQRENRVTIGENIYKLLND